MYNYYWERYQPNWSHDMVATHYRTTIADMLEEFDNSAYDNSVYKAIAWMGLGEYESGESTIAWKNLSEGEKKAIKDIWDEHFFDGPSNCI